MLRVELRIGSGFAPVDYVYVGASRHTASGRKKRESSDPLTTSYETHLLLLGDFHCGARGFPIQTHGASLAVAIESDREILYR